MMIDRRALLGAAGAAIAAPVLAQGQAPLSGTGRIICGFPAGGTVDTTARRLGDFLRGRLVETMIVENRVGAGGRIAINSVKDQAPDGRTLLLSPDSMMTIYTSVYRKLGYDPAVDLVPVTSVCSYTFAFGVGPGVPESVRTLGDYIAWAKADPNRGSYASPAPGSMPHFLGDIFFRAAGIAPKHVPYRGSAPAINDLLGGHVPGCMTVLGDFLPQVGNPQLRMLAVSDQKRSRFMPSVPTFAEQGFGKVQGVETYGVFLPKGAAADVVSRLNGLLREVLADPAMIEGLARIGMDAAHQGPSAYAEHLARERLAWGPVVQASGFSLEE